ncbi:MAG: tetratricopeptide repeat protein [Planctomycetota bacterium]
MRSFAQWAAAIALAVAAACAHTRPAEEPAMVEYETASWRPLWDYGDPAGSEERLRDAAVRAGDTELRLEIRTQVARALGLQRRFDEAFAELAAVESEAAPASARLESLLHLERGRTLRSSGDVDAARPEFVAAFEAAHRAHLDYLAVDAAHMLGIVEPGDAGLDWNARALDVAATSPDPAVRGWAAVIANNRGWTLFDLGRYEESLASLERALVLRRERPEQEEPIRIARWCVARLHRALGRNEEALAEQRALLAEYEALGEPSGYVHEELGELLLLAGDVDAARPHLAVAHELLSQDPWLVESEPARLERLRSLARGEEGK